jgi:hypothetical protein
MKRFVLAFVASSAVAITVSASASAQVWLKDRAATQGAGIRSGDLEWHPGVAAELGYDSNYFNRAPNNRSGESAVNRRDGYPVVDTVRLRITPSFFVTTLSQARRADGTAPPPPKVAFSAGLAFIYSQFLMNAGENVGGVRDRLGRNFEYGVLGDLALQISPGRPWGFNIFDNFQRTAQPSLDPLVEAGLNRIENRVAAELVHTRPGNLFDWRLGYGFGITYFENGPTNNLPVTAQSFNNYRHELYTSGRWRFLPRTALVYNGSYWFQQYNTTTPGLANSRPLRTRIGLSGLITDRFSVLGLIGWGASFYQNATGNAADNRDFDSVIGQLELRWFLTGAAPEAGLAPPPLSSSVALGFTRDFSNSYIGNYYVRNRGYLSLSTMVAQRLLITADAGFAGIQYADVLDRTTGQTLVRSFTNGRADATLFLEYRVKDWLGLNATYNYLAEFSDTSLPANALRQSRYLMAFQRHQIFAGIRAFF